MSSDANSLLNRELEVACSNTAAVQMYRELGFKKRRLIRNYYGVGECTDAWRMFRPSQFRLPRASL